MGAEDAAEHVRLVDHHEGEPQEEVGPPGVIGEQRRVEHVGVRQHEVRVRPDQRAFRPRRVPVVDGRFELRELERTDRAELVAREGLRREEEQRRGFRDGERGVGERELVHERLPAGGPRREHHVAAVREHLEPLGLVRVQALDPEQSQPADQQLRKVGRERTHERRARGKVLHVDQRSVGLGIGGQVVEERLRVHRSRLRGGDVTSGSSRRTACGGRRATGSERRGASRRGSRRRRPGRRPTPRTAPPRAGAPHRPRRR